MDRWIECLWFILNSLSLALICDHLSSYCVDPLPNTKAFQHNWITDVLICCTSHTKYCSCFMYICLVSSSSSHFLCLCSLPVVSQTPMNQASTRSHCIFTIHLCSREPGSATVRRSKLHLVDLAGSERVGKTGVGGQILTEAKYINLSLHYLEQVSRARFCVPKGFFDNVSQNV